MKLRTLPLLLAGTVVAGACAAPATTDPGRPAAVQALGPVANAPALDLRQMSQLDRIVPQLADYRVVFVGESHDQFAHHLVQLGIIRALHENDPDLAIGLEFFQTPYQSHLDRYVSGAIDEAEMLASTEYFERWRYDYRLYRPILTFAREHGIPLLALNVPAELTRRVAESGIAGLGEEERAQLPPELGEPGPGYRERLQGIFAQHPDTEQRDFEHFVEAQLLWDEGMAATAADYLRARPNTRLVILAGSGHIAGRIGIPQRLERRTGIRPAVVLNGPTDELSPATADFLVLPDPVELPPKGMLGILMDWRDGTVVVDGFAEPSPAAAAGLEQGDHLVTLAGRPIASLQDVRLAMLDAAPGDTVGVTVRRPRLFGADEVKEYRVELANTAAPPR